MPQVDTVEQAQYSRSRQIWCQKLWEAFCAPLPLLPNISMQRCDPSLSFWENQNQQAAVIIQVESLEGIHNLDEIVISVGVHIDSVWLGNLDCRVVMGLPGFLGEEPEWVHAMNILRATLSTHNKSYSGLALGDDEWLKKRGEGRSLMFMSSDLAAVFRTADELVNVRNLFPPKNDSEKE